MTQRIRIAFPLSNLILSCVTCDIGCCGLVAYNPNIEQFHKWQQEEGNGDLKECLEQLDRLIGLASLDESVEVNFGDFLVSFDKENNRIMTEPFYDFSGKEWGEFLQDWKRELHKALGI